MEVFKFGGASVKDAAAVKNTCKIIGRSAGEKLLVVVSAMANTTDQLAHILNAKFKKEPYEEKIKIVAAFHTKVASELFEKDHYIFSQLNELIRKLQEELEQEANFNLLYAQVLSKGELLSSRIVAAYLNEHHTPAVWLDARAYIRTDNNFKEAKIDWKVTEALIRKDILLKAEKGVLITQGFIGMSEKQLTTTLGREGSDFSAAIFASCISATAVTVWKDVPGILNADPKLVPDAILFKQLPYKEAAEMTYYGASVIHPKTIKPLANRSIPLYVKSFDHPDEEGTIIHHCQLTEYIPTVIIKHNQCLVSFKVLDFTYINEENLSLIFRTLSEVDLHINIMQNSAISFSIVVDYDVNKVENLLDALKDHFAIRYNTGLKLITVKNYAEEIINKYRMDQKILLEQISRNNFRALVAP